MADFNRPTDHVYRLLGREVDFVPRIGAARKITILRPGEPDLRGVQGIEAFSEGFIWKCRQSEVARPTEGDHIVLPDGRLMQIKSKPRVIGRRELQWLLDCREVDQIT